MKRLLTAAAVVLLAVPAFAQDEIVLTGGDIDSLLGGGGGGGRGGNNRGGGRGNNNVPDPVTMYDQLKDLLKTKKVPLEKNQEKPLQTLLNNESKAIQAFIDEQFGNRGQQNGNRGNNNFMVQIDSVITKHNAELLTQIKPVLAPDQLPLLEKAEKDKKACTVMLDVLNPQQFNNNNNNQNVPAEIANRPRCTSQQSSTAQRVAVLGDMLNKGKKPLTADQLAKVTSLVEARFPLIQEEMRATGLPADLFNRNNNNNNQAQPNPQQLTNNIVNTIMTQLGVPNNNNNNQNRGNRGNQQNPNQPNPEQAANFNRGNPGGQQGQQGQQGNRGNNNNFNPQQDVQRRTDEILDKVIASLKPDQQPVVKKFKYDIIKQRGPLDRVRAILEEEGTPMTPEQATQVQALFNSQNQAIRNFALQLVQTEVAALPPTAFQPAPQPTQNQNQNQNRNNNNQNQNNVNQNPAAQQIVAKVLPQVSVRKALLERATNESILTKVLTPSQVASYKLNSL